MVEKFIRTEADNPARVRDEEHQIVKNVNKSQLAYTQTGIQQEKEQSFWLLVGLHIHVDMTDGIPNQSNARRPNDEHVDG